MSAVAVDSAVGRLLASLEPADRLVALARVLHREGYDDHTTGHITFRQPWSGAGTRTNTPTGRNLVGRRARPVH